MHLIIFHLDIVECDSSNSPCGANAECKDTDGSFECSCKLGFSGDGFICTGAIKLLQYALLE